MTREDLLARARLIKPFPVKRLADALYHVQAEAHSIDQRLLRLQLDPPRLPEHWYGELEALTASLGSLEALCGDAVPVLGRMADQADGDWQRGLDVIVSMMRGLSDAEDVAA
jgi:hypothetical protein